MDIDISIHQFLTPNIFSNNLDDSESGERKCLRGIASNAKEPDCSVLDLKLFVKLISIIFII